MKHCKYLCLFLSTIAAIFCIACKPTPNFTQFQKTENISQYCDAFLQNISLTDGIQLNYDAHVYIPDHSLSRGEFIVGHYSKDIVCKTYEALCCDALIYQHAETKQQLIDYVAYGKMALALLSNTISENILQNELSELDSISNIADEAATDKAPANLDQITEYDQGLVDVRMGGSKDAIFQVLTSPRYWIFFGNYQRPVPSNEPCKEPLKISHQDAVSLAENALRKIGILDDFSLARSDEEVINYTYYQTFFDDDTKNKAHILLYLRRINDDPQLDDSRILLGTTNQYDLSFLQEYILFKIDDNGILSFEWNTPGELQLTDEPESVITFNDAVSVATNQMKVSFTKYTFEGAAPADISVCIDKIALGYILHEGTGNTVDVLPAWEFYGYIVDESKSEGTDRYYDVNTKSWTNSYEDNVSLCVINALNGKVIDRIGKY
ncbi:MAG TPA: DUF6034 family protein [Clostridia bacterium]|nr:DUF6034 family protein [Clostridia bacterium]